MKLRMVDRILKWEAGRELHALKAVSFEEYKLKAAFGDDARLPESLLLQCLVQSCNWLVVLSSDFENMAVVKEFATVLFPGRLRPGETLAIEVQVKQYDEGLAIFEARGIVGRKSVVQVGECIMEPLSLAEHCDPADLRVLYSEIGPIAPDYSMK